MNITVIDECIAMLEGNSGKLPSVEQVQHVCKHANEYYKTQVPNVVELEGPLTIVGGVRGHFKELLEIFKFNGSVPTVKYLFLGGYINRGTVLLFGFLISKKF